MAFSTAAVVAGTVLTGMYLDGKYAIRKDLNDWRRTKIITDLYIDAVKRNRQSCYYFFESSVLAHPNSECIWSRSGSYTWAQTNDLVNQYGQWFLAQGVRPKDYVAFNLMNGPDFIFAWLGLWSIGAAPAMINYNLSGNALMHCLGVCGAKLLLVDEDSVLRGRIEEVKERIGGELGMRICIVDNSLKSEVRRQKTERIPDTYRQGVRADWPVSMFYTSGTTGMPKGVAFNTDRAFTSGAGRSKGIKAVCLDDDRWYNCMPYYHGTGGMTAITNMMQGITLCIGIKFSTKSFWQDCCDSRATWITYVGETARYLLAAPPSPLDKQHNVRAMYGNGLRPDVWTKFRDRFNVPEVVEFFNSSEGVFGLAIYSRGDYFATSVGHHGLIIRHLYRNVLVPVKVDDVSGAILRDLKTGFAIRESYSKGGEMIVQIPNKKVFAGYHGNSLATEKKFERDVFKKGDLWYRSGDALRRTDDGRWFFLDRLGDTFRWKGENVSTAEVAEVMGRYPGVVEANVYGVALPSHDGRAGCAALYIDPAHQKSFDFAGLLKHTRQHLPSYAVPLFVRIVKEMTPIHNNKQNKVPLREEGVDPERVNKSDDKMLWVKGKESMVYEDFSLDHWEDLKLGKARL